MRVFLTGATGFIGSHLARLLVREGCQVTALVRRGANLWRIADIERQMTLVEGDLFVLKSIDAAVRAASPELFMHLGWYTAPDGRSHYQSLENLGYLTGSLALVRALDAAGCRRLVLAGTSFEYDPDSGCVSENSPISPRNLYAASKYSLFVTAQALARQQKWTLAEARIFNVYGPDDDSRRLVPDVIQNLLMEKTCEMTRGDQVRDFLHVHDVANALWVIAKSNMEGAVNIGSSVPVSVAALAREIGVLLNRTELLKIGAKTMREGDPPILYANTSRLRSLGWKEGYGLETGLQSTIDWWKKEQLKLLHEKRSA